MVCGESAGLDPDVVAATPPEVIFSSLNLIPISKRGGGWRRD